MTLRSLAAVSTLIFAGAAAPGRAQPRLVRRPSKRPVAAPRPASRALGTRQEQRPAPEVSVTETTAGPEAAPNITIRVLGDPPAGKGSASRTARSAAKPIIRVTFTSPREPAAHPLRYPADQPGHLSGEN